MRAAIQHEYEDSLAAAREGIVSRAVLQWSPAVRDDDRERLYIEAREILRSIAYGPDSDAVPVRG